jgi:hypothetical protein
MQISTLAKLVRALGGELEISVKQPNGRVNLAQFSPPDALLAASSPWCGKGSENKARPLRLNPPEFESPGR